MRRDSTAKKLLLDKIDKSASNGQVSKWKNHLHYANAWVKM